jgi:hypothetical protein
MKYYIIHYAKAGTHGRIMVKALCTNRKAAGSIPE